jgi:glycosyltransferase involved in cell wall biosynthesis
VKIFYLHYGLQSGGAERLIVDLCNKLSLDNEVILCVTDTSSNPKNLFYKHELSSRVCYINLECKSGLSIKSFISVFTTIYSKQPDIVHCHADLLLLFLPSLFLRNIKYIHTLHNEPDKCLTNISYKKIYRFFYKNFVKPIVISPYMQTLFIQFYSLNNSININNGVSKEKYFIDLNKVTDKINGLKKHSDDLVFLNIARCVPQKNHKMLIDSFNYLISNGFRIILLVIGSGIETEFAKNIISESKDGIFFLGEKDNIFEYLLCADFFVLSSLWEGLPISLLEALSLGVIPICTPAGGIVDVIKNRKHGFISSSFNTHDFIETLKYAILNSHTIDRQHLKHYFDENFSIERCYNKHVELYKS